MSKGVRGCKIINIQTESRDLQVAMVVIIKQEEFEKLGVQAQLLPTQGENYLPPNIQLTLYSRTNRMLQSIQSREQDNYIQLKPFKGKEGTYFSLEVRFEDVSIRENFEL